MPRKARRSTWGCVEVVVKNRKHRIRYWADTGDGRGYRQHSETFHGTYSEAEQRRAELRALYGRRPGESARRYSNLTVGEVWDKIVAPDRRARLEEGSLAPNTWRNAVAAWRNHVAPRWADVRCGDVEPLEVQKWLLDLPHNAANRSRVLLGQIMNAAVMYRVCQDNPMRAKYRIPAKGDGGRDRGVYTAEELGAVYAAVLGSPIEPAVSLAALGSCRVGESLGVRSDEVSLAEHGGVPVAVAPIRRQVTDKGGVTKLKTRQSARHVVVPGPPGLRLKAVADARVAEGAPWLCDTGMGTPIPQWLLDKMWTELLASAGVERHPLKNLRNTWETIARWRLRIEPHMIGKMMGHAGASMAEIHYDRPDVEVFVETVAEAYKRSPYADTWDIL